MSWDQPVNIVKRLKAFQRLFNHKKLSKKSKGAFGEALAAYALTHKFSLQLYSKNIVTSYGEIDLVLSDDQNKFFLFVEVKMILIERESKNVWSFQQRGRFNKSMNSLSQNKMKGRREAGLFLVYPDEVQFLNLNEA